MKYISASDLAQINDQKEENRQRAKDFKNWVSPIDQFQIAMAKERERRE